MSKRRPKTASKHIGPPAAIRFPPSLPTSPCDDRLLRPRSRASTANKRDRTRVSRCSTTKSGFLEHRLAPHWTLIRKDRAGRHPLDEVRGPLSWFDPSATLGQTRLPHGLYLPERHSKTSADNKLNPPSTGTYKRNLAVWSRYADSDPANTSSLRMFARHLRHGAAL